MVNYKKYLDKKQMVICPECGHKKRMPINKHEVYICPKCLNSFFNILYYNILQEDDKSDEVQRLLKKKDLCVDLQMDMPIKVRRAFLQKQLQELIKDGHPEFVDWGIL